MTNKQFNSDFIQNVLIPSRDKIMSGGFVDQAMCREAYSSALDAAHRDGTITDRQAQNWNLPTIKRHHLMTIKNV